MQLSLISLALTKFYGGGASFSPASLFASGEQGAWYDPSDLSTMFQDSAGTTPVTADGQPVGLILDKSGRGNHATQATAASRPLYKTDGTYHWLQFDGVDDSLSTAAINFTSTDKMSWFVGARRNTATPTAILFELGPGSVVGSMYLAAPEGVNIYGIGAMASNAYAQFFTDTPAPTTVVLSSNLDLSSTVPSIRISARKNNNPISLNSSAGILGTPTQFSNNPLNIGRRNNSSLPFNGNIYSLIVQGALSTAQQITDTETWINGKTGAY